jgi:DNA-directed RNA polymerase subunit M/transcription elongation factor TFIIS
MSTVLTKPQNMKILEKKIYDVSQEADDPERSYYTTMYQVMTDIISGKKLLQIGELLDSQKVEWEHPSYDKVRDRICEQDNFIENPFEVEEGVLQCRCGSKKVFSYCRQVKSSDEGTTSFAQCMKCGKKWTEGG